MGPRETAAVPDAPIRLGDTTLQQSHTHHGTRPAGVGPKRQRGPQREFAHVKEELRRQDAQHGVLSVAHQNLPAHNTAIAAISSGSPRRGEFNTSMKPASISGVDQAIFDGV